MAGDDEFSIRFYDGEANDRLLTLLRAAFGRWPSADSPVDAADHLEWKLSSPGAHGCHIVVEAQGTMIGCRLTLARRMKLRGEEVPARFGVDSAVHPDWQRRGVMNRMRDFGREELAERFDLHFGTTNNEFVLRRDLRERRLVANQIDVLERNTVDATAPVDVPAPIDVPGFMIREVTAFDDRIEDFWRAASRQFDVAVVRSCEFLNWRYADSRAGRFTILLAECDGQLIGYAVLATSGEKGQIADLLVLPERLDALQALLQAALSRLAGSGASRVQVWSPQLHPYRDTFVTNGFNATRTLQGVTLGAYRAELQDALGILDDPAAAVHIMAGDTDLV